MGVGKSIARALLSGVSSSAGSVADLEKSRIMSNDQLANALAELGARASYERSNEEARLRLANELEKPHRDAQIALLGEQATGLRSERERRAEARKLAEGLLRKEGELRAGSVQSQLDIRRGARLAAEAAHQQALERGMTAEEASAAAKQAAGGGVLSMVTAPHRALQANIRRLLGASPAEAYDVIPQEKAKIAGLRAAAGVRAAEEAATRERLQPEIQRMTAGGGVQGLIDKYLGEAVMSEAYPRAKSPTDIEADQAAIATKQRFADIQQQQVENAQNPRKVLSDSVLSSPTIPPAAKPLIQAMFNGQMTLEQAEASYPGITQLIDQAVTQMMTQ